MTRSLPSSTLNLRVTRELMPKVSLTLDVFNLGDRKVEFANAQARMDRVQQLVAEKMKQAEFANDYNGAFAAVEKENPELFRQMQPAK